MAVTTVPDYQRLPTIDIAEPSPQREGLRWSVVMLAENWLDPDDEDLVCVEIEAETADQAMSKANDDYGEWVAVRASLDGERGGRANEK